MAEFNPLPPEYKHPEEYPAPAPGIFPPPEEGSAGAAAGEGSGRKRRNWSSKSALLLAAAGITLLGVLHTAPTQPAAAEPPAETVAAQPVTEPAPTQPAPTQPAPTETEPAAPTDAERLVAVGTWKNAAESEWVHFDADNTGWWYDGTYFGRMTWQEDASGSVSYEAGIAYLSPELKFNDAPGSEREEDCLHSAKESGSIELYPEEDHFACPGLRFGAGSYLPDDTAIDDTVMDGVCGKTLTELLAGTSWHMAQTGDLGIPFAPAQDVGKTELYTDLVYVQSIDFSAGTFTLTTRDGGFLEEDYYTADGSFHTGTVDHTFRIPFSPVSEENGMSSAVLKLDLDAMFTYYSDYRSGDEDYNYSHLLWGRSYRSADAHESVYLLLTASGIRLGMDTVDLFTDNYTLLAQD